MDFKDYYKVMGVAEKATQADIKLAYRKLARKFHPDVSKEPDAATRFKEIGEAYEVLRDAEKRAEYDQIRALRTARGRRRSGGADAGMSEEEANRQFNEFFESIFSSGGVGRGGHRSHKDYQWATSFSHRGQDLHHRLVLFLEEAILGAQRSLKLEVPGTDAQGNRQTKTKMLNVKIPAGVIPGQRIRLAGQGGAGYGKGEAGDLFLEIELAPHPLFAVDGLNVLLALPVSPWEAALGASVEVPTVTGPVKLTIPKGSFTGKRLRVKGHGLGKKPAGDLIVNVQVTLPTHHSAKAEALYRELAEVEAAFNPRKSLGKGL